MKKILIDIDGVLADWSNLNKEYEKYVEELGVNINTPGYELFESEIYTEWCELPPLRIFDS